MRKEYGFLTFLSYAVLGWCYEVFLETAIYHWGFSNRGFLFGPYCPVYGFGALLLFACLRPLRGVRRKAVLPPLVFAAAMLLATMVELLTSYLLEAVTGGWLWDYHSYAVQYDGRIALSPSLRFGLGGLFFCYIVQPLLQRAAAKIGEEGCRRAARVLFAGFLLDFCISAALRLC